MRRYSLSLLVLLLVGLLLSACAEEGSATGAVEDYIKAKVASDADKLADLACNAWDAQAVLDAQSFESVKAEAEDLSCSEDGTDGDYTLVTCTGQIVAEYDGETRTQDLGGTTYRAIEEDGEWKMCGEVN